MQGRLLIAFALAMVTACAHMDLKPYSESPEALPKERTPSQARPVIEVRVATKQQATEIEEFPGKKQFESSAKTDAVGAGAFVVATLPFWLPFMAAAAADHVLIHERPTIHEPSPDELTALLQNSLNQRVRDDLPLDAHEVLEVVYSGGVRLVGPAGDRDCFILHARVTLRDETGVIYQGIVHIDPRVVEDDYLPGCLQDADSAKTYFESSLPELIERRLPGLPWVLAGS